MQKVFRGIMEPISDLPTALTEIANLRANADAVSDLFCQTRTDLALARQRVNDLNEIIAEQERQHVTVQKTIEDLTAQLKTKDAQISTLRLEADKSRELFEGVYDHRQSLLIECSHLLLTQQEVCGELADVIREGDGLQDRLDATVGAKWREFWRTVSSFDKRIGPGLRVK